jgi:hypothetical protein
MKATKIKTPATTPAMASPKTSTDPPKFVGCAVISNPSVIRSNVALYKKMARDDALSASAQYRPCASLTTIAIRWTTPAPDTVLTTEKTTPAWPAIVL